MSILIVDDNAMNAKILEFNLNKSGYQTLAAPSGSAALACLEDVPEVQLVISDIMMPEMDGLELLDRIKERPEWRNLPVIMCTALSDVETVRKAAKAGCRNYIVKPIKAVQLIQKVREILGHEEAVLKDRARIMVELGIDQELYDDLRRAFTALVEETIAMLDEAPGKELQTKGTVNVMNLLESASMMGAGRVARILDNVLGSGEGALDQALLVRELKVLYKVLTGEEEKTPAAPEALVAQEPAADAQATAAPVPVEPSTPA
jgi:CheY-like chemotaxis protein